MPVTVFLKRRREEEPKNEMCSSWHFSLPELWFGNELANI